MKKMLATILAVVTVFGMSTPLAATASAASTAENNVIELEYMDFMTNEDYYRTLAKEDGYVLVINVPDEYAEEEMTRNNVTADTTTGLSSGMARGQSKPTAVHNILTSGTLTLSATNNVSVTLYSEKLITGWTSYEVSVYNKRTDHNTFSFSAYQDNFPFDTKISSEYTVEPGQRVIMYVAPDSASSKWFLRFQGYSSLTGYIARDI